MSFTPKQRALIVEPYILCVTEFLTCGWCQSMDDTMLVNKLCSIARAFPRCTGICIQKPKWKYNLCIQKPKWNTASFVFKLHKNYHTINQGNTNYANHVKTLCDWVSQLLYKTSPQLIQLLLGVAGDMLPQKFIKIRCYELVNFGKVGQWTGTTNVTDLLYFWQELCSFWVQTSVSHFHYM